MGAVTLIFPHQLFKNNLAFNKGRRLILIEEFLFFKQYNFHKQKLVLHRASMKAYQQYLKENDFEVTYIDAQSPLSNVKILIDKLCTELVESLHIAEVVDDFLLKRISSAVKKNGMSVEFYKTPSFINTIEEAKPFFDKKKNYFQTDFYIWQRKSRQLLLEEDGKPIGGKWSYDAENRKKFPKNEHIPILEKPKTNVFVKEAIKYVNSQFKCNYGVIEEFIYPTTFAEAEKWLDDFLKVRFHKFGIYEDAIVADESFLYHSVLTPVLNIGLVTPKQIIDKAIQASIDYNVPLNSLEGFIRQIMGWREFIRIVYEREGVKQRTKNYWGFTRKIPKTFWTGNTGIEPIDIIIKKLLSTGYSHHIERLMVLGNFMLLCEFDPDEVYKWFMEMYVDSYDWVMVPNVYGMTQFADGGLMTTKPYISGSNYLLKMGNWGNVCKDSSWQVIWDGLFWRFMDTHRNFFLKNPRLGMLVNTLDKMSSEKKESHLRSAEIYLKQLDSMESNL